MTQSISATNTDGESKLAFIVSEMLQYKKKDVKASERDSKIWVFIMNVGTD